MYGNSGVQTYRRTDINTMTKEKMIVLLYEKIIADLEEAGRAIAAGNRLNMTQRVNHSQRIVAELRNALDHKIGGDIAAQLDSIYDYMFHEHLELLVDQDPRHVRNCIDVLAPLLESWRQIPGGTGDRAARDLAAGPPPGTPENSTDGPNPASSGREEASRQESAPVQEAETSGLFSVSA